MADNAAAAAAAAPPPARADLLAGQPWWEELWAARLTPLLARAEALPVRTLPAYVFACLNLLLFGVDVSSHASSTAGSVGSIVVRVLAGALLSLHPAFGKPAQRGPAFVALLAAAVFYGGWLGPRYFPGERHLAKALDWVHGLLRLPALPARLQREAAVDEALRYAAAAALLATLVVSSTHLFQWELRGAHEAAEPEARPGAAARSGAVAGVAAGPAAGAAAAAAAEAAAPACAARLMLRSLRC